MLRLIAPALLLAACTFARPADVQFGESAITIKSGDGQGGIAGGRLAMPFAVTVTDADFRPIENFTVRFEVLEGGGEMVPKSVRTDVLGNAEATLTLGTLVGVNTVAASGEGISGEPVQFVATALVGPAARLVAVSGHGESTVVGSALAAPLVARLEDQYTNPIADAAIEFATTGGGTLSTTTGTTGADGTAQTMLTAGTVAGAQVVTATLGDLSATFSVTATPDVASSIHLVSGTPQLGDALTAVAPLVVRVRDQHGNAVPGTTIDFVRTQGTSTLATASATTDGQGNAQAVLTLGGLGDTSRVEARATGLTGSPVVFAATARTLSPKVEFTFGSSQTAAATADFNGDNKRDLVVAVSSSSARGISVRLNTTPPNSAIPTFAPAVVFPCSATCISSADFVAAVAVGDLSGDGLVDVAIGTSARIDVFVNTTAPGALTPSFAAAVGFSNDFYTADPLEIADLDGDGLSDLVFKTGFELYHRRNTTAATLSFASREQTSSGTNAVTAIVPVELTGDNRRELVVAAGSANVLRNTSTGTTISFATAIGLGSARGVAVADFNGDALLDVVAGYSQNVRIIRNTTVNVAMPTFAAALNFTGASDNSKLAVGDFNGDGKPDLVTAPASTGSNIAVLLNATTSATAPSLLAPQLFPVSTSNTPVVADFNGDGRSDIAAIGPNVVSVFLMQQ